MYSTCDTPLQLQVKHHSAVKKLKLSERWLEHWEWLNQQFGGFWGKKHTLVSSATQQGLDVHERQQCWIMAESFPWWRKTPSQPSEEHSSVSGHISSPGPINTFPLPMMLFHHHICFSNLFDSGRPGFSFSTTAGLPAGRWVLTQRRSRPDSHSTNEESLRTKWLRSSSYKHLL